MTKSQELYRAISVALKENTLRSFLLSCTLVLGAALPIGNARAQTALPDTIAQRTIACAACHGNEDRATSDGYYPRIAGKPAGYLYNQLVNFRDGRRTYPLMIHMVDHLSDAYLHEMADYFAGLHQPYAARQARSATTQESVLERGRTIVLSGDASRNVPACIACHGKSLTGTAPSIPGLAGLPFDYMSAQLGAWKNGTRRAADPDCMAQITSRLAPADLSAALAWLGAQPIPSENAPAAAGTAKLPLRCGSVPQ